MKGTTLVYQNVEVRVDYTDRLVWLHKTNITSRQNSLAIDPLERRFCEAN